jgi:hypothetical protein
LWKFQKLLGVFLLAPVKLKQDPVIAKMYAKEKTEALLAKRLLAKKLNAGKLKCKVSSLLMPKSKTKLNVAKPQRYSKRN